VPFSYLDLEVHDGYVDGRIRAHLTDLAPVLGVSDPRELLEPTVINAHRRQLQSYLAARIAFENDGFARAEWGQLAIVDESQALELQFRIPGNPPARSHSTPTCSRPTRTTRRSSTSMRTASCASSSSSRR
jgi:hypothetical protein